jgi:hypothetical protein
MKSRWICRNNFNFIASANLASIGLPKHEKRIMANQASDTKVEVLFPHASIV